MRHYIFYAQISCINDQIDLKLSHHHKQLFAHCPSYFLLTSQNKKEYLRDIKDFKEQHNNNHQYSRSDSLLTITKLYSFSHISWKVAKITYLNTCLLNRRKKIHTPSYQISTRNFKCKTLCLTRTLYSNKCYTIDLPIF